MGLYIQSFISHRVETQVRYDLNFPRTFRRYSVFLAEKVALNQKPILVGEFTSWAERMKEMLKAGLYFAIPFCWNSRLRAAPSMKGSLFPWGPCKAFQSFTYGGTGRDSNLSLVTY